MGVGTHPYVITSIRKRVEGWILPTARKPQSHTSHISPFGIDKLDKASRFRLKYKSDLGILHI